MEKKRGFTLVEVLVVIAIIGTLVSLAAISVTGVLNREKERLAKQEEKNLANAAVAYIQDKKIKLTECNSSFDPKNPSSTFSSCYREILVSDIKNSGLFTDDKNYCNASAKVVVYKKKNAEYSDILAYVKEGTCS